MRANFRHAMAAVACAAFMNASCGQALAQERACGSREPVNTIAAMFDAI